jgi:hypothetical protein
MDACVYLPDLGALLPEKYDAETHHRKDGDCCHYAGYNEADTPHVFRRCAATYLVRIITTVVVTITREVAGDADPVIAEKVEIFKFYGGILVRAGV